MGVDKVVDKVVGTVARARCELKLPSKLSLNSRGILAALSCGLFRSSLRPQGDDIVRPPTMSALYVDKDKIRHGRALRSSNIEV